MSRRVVALVVAGALAVGLVGVVAWRVLGQRSEYEHAMALLPAGTLRATYTDWAAVRETADGTALGSASSRDEVESFLSRAYDQDLISTSGIDESTYVLVHRYGFSPLDAQWEVLGQSREGQVDVMRVGDGVDLTGVERALRRLGYTPPDSGSGTGGTWAGGADLVAALDPDLSPVQQNFVVLPDQHLVLMSDSADYVTRAADVITGSGRSLLDTAGVSALASAAGEPVSAVLWASTFACEDLTMGQADDEDQRVADQLVQEAGGVAPLSGLVMSQQASREIVVGMHFESNDQASANLQPRVDLASGDAPGQGGTFADRFRVTSGEADGSDVVLTLQPRAGDAVLSDLSQGPVLFATC